MMRSPAFARAAVTGAARPQLLARGFASGKDIRMGTEARALMLQGVDQLADAVQVTLGPKGRNVIIEAPFGGPKITKDGVTVAKNIEFADRQINLGAALVRSVASKTNDQAGDGTTTATILARAIYSEGCKAVAAGMNPMDLRKGVMSATEAVVEELGKMSKPTDTADAIKSVATISANNDPEIGGLLSRAMSLVGAEGVITVQDGKTMTHEIEHTEGMKFDRGFISPYFMTNTKTQKVEYEKAYVLLCAKKISSIQQITPILEKVLRTGDPLLIIAEDVDSEALATLIVNRLRGQIKVSASKAPGFGDNRKAMLQDMAVLTGGEVVSDDLGITLENLELENLGQVKKIEQSKDDTLLLIDDGANSDEIEDRCEQLRDSIADTKSDYEKEKMQERLARLSSGVAVIKVGGASDVEVSEAKDRVQDALCATQAAVDEGIVAGGGVALLNASKVLNEMIAVEENPDIKFGLKIVLGACRVPITTIASNAGEQGAVIVEKILQQDDANFGFDAYAGEYKDMIEAGIIDPRKVTRTALQDAAGVASLMCTSEAMITDLPADPADAAAGGAMGGMGGGMGGMGGMM